MTDAPDVPEPTADPGPAGKPVADACGPASPRSRRLGRFLMAFAVIVVVAELGVRVLSPAMPEPLTWFSRFAQVKAEKLAERQAGPGPQVVFIGSSQMATAIDPADVTASDPCGRVGFNAAVIGAYPTINERWIRDAVLPNVAPEVVVIGTTTRDLLANESLELYDRQLATRTDVLASLDRTASDVSAIVKYRSVLRDPRRWFTEVVEDAPEIVANGFDRSRGHNRYEVGAYDVGTLGRFEVDAEEIDALRRTVRDLQGRGIRVVIADMAVTDDYVAAHTDGAADVARYRAVIEDLARVEGARFVDLVPSIRDRSEFADPIHANLQGAAIESRAMGTALAAEPC